MAYGREWTGRIEYKTGGEKRMAWSYQGTPAAAQQKGGQTLAPRAQLILSVDATAVRDEVFAAAIAAAEEVPTLSLIVCTLGSHSTPLSFFSLVLLSGLTPAAAAVAAVRRPVA
jgi:hypothetical protein